MVVRMVRLPEALEIRGKSKSQHYADIARGRFPRPVKIGPRASAWPESDFEDEQQAQLAERAARSGTADDNKAA
jgi:prophage regulatory protein